MDESGFPQAFVIAGGDGLWKVDRRGNFTFQGTYARQISAGDYGQVFAIATDNSAYEVSNGVTTRLGGYLKQVSSGPGGREVFGIGSNDEVFVNHLDGRGWAELHGFAKEISAPVVSYGADVVYTVGTYHEGYLHDAQGWTNLQRYLLGPSSGQTISAVSWLGDDGVKHHRTYAIGADDALYVSQDGSAFTSLGGYVKQVSAGMDAAGNRRAYAIGGEDALWVIDDSGNFTRLGPYATQISATANDLGPTGRGVYAIDPNRLFLTRPLSRLTVFPGVVQVLI